MRLFQHDLGHAESPIVAQLGNGNHPAACRIRKLFDKQIAAAIVLEDKRISVEPLPIIWEDCEWCAVESAGFGDACPVDQPIGDLPVEGAPAKFELLLRPAPQVPEEMRKVAAEKFVACRDRRWQIAHWYELAGHKTSNALHEQRNGSSEQVVATAGQPETIPLHWPPPGNGRSIEANGQFRQAFTCQYLDHSRGKGIVAAKFERQDRHAWSSSAGGRVGGEVDDNVRRAGIALGQWIGKACQRGTETPALDRQDSVQSTRSRRGHRYMAARNRMASRFQTRQKFILPAPRSVSMADD